MTSYRCLHKKQHKNILCNNFRFKLNHSLNEKIRLTECPSRKTHPSIHSSPLPLIAHLSTPINLAICWVSWREQQKLAETTCGSGKFVEAWIWKTQVMMGTEGFLHNSGWNRHCWSWRIGTSNNETFGEPKHQFIMFSWFPHSICWDCFACPHSWNTDKPSSVFFSTAATSTKVGGNLPCQELPNYKDYDGPSIAEGTANSCSRHKLTVKKHNYLKNEIFWLVKILEMLKWRAKIPDKRYCKSKPPLQTTQKKNTVEISWFDTIIPKKRMLFAFLVQKPKKMWG